MNIRLIMGILGGIIAAEFVAILVQLNIYKKEIDKGIEYENFRKQVLLKAAKERRELREALAKQQELKDRMEELRKKREKTQESSKTKEEEMPKTKTTAGARKAKTTKTTTGATKTKKTK